MTPGLRGSRQMYTRARHSQRAGPDRSSFRSERLYCKYCLLSSWPEAAHNSKQKKRSEIEEYCPGAQPIQSDIVVFQAPPQMTPQPFGNEGDVCFAIALTPWTPETGSFIFSTRGVQEEPRLEPGDGVLWPGECLTSRGSGQGGIFVLIKLVPGVRTGQATQG